MFSRLRQIQADRVLLWVSCGAASAAALCSLSWRMVHDTPIMLYQANLMVKHGLMPYRDFFCINLPGSLWLYGWVIRLFGVTDLSVHVANLLIVAGVATLSFFALSETCRRCAALGVALGVLRIFSGEVAFILERELLALIPIAGLAYLSLRSPVRERNQAAVAGLLMAWLFLIKPQLVLYGLPAVAYLWMESAKPRRTFSLFLVMGAAFALPVAGCGLWIAGHGAWPRFLETLEYWTLYGQMTQSFTYVAPQERAHDVLTHALRMIFSPYLLAAGAALYAAWQGRLLGRSQLVFWVLLLAMTVFVPALSGQFWGYHRLPFFYFTLCASGYLLAGRAWSRGLAFLAVAFWVPFTALRVYRETAEPSAIRLTHGIADVFEAHLRQNLRAGDRVQPIDWTYGAVQGMLLTDAMPATRFIESSYFLHSVSHPLIKKIRSEFLASLEKQPPRFILEALNVRWPNGRDTEETFAAFETWRSAHYVARKEGEHYRIWEYQP